MSFLIDFFLFVIFIISLYPWIDKLDGGAELDENTELGNHIIQRFPQGKDRCTADPPSRNSTQRVPPNLSLWRYQTRFHSSSGSSISSQPKVIQNCLLIFGKTMNRR